MIHIAEVQAFSGGENVALKGKATQSSTASTARPKRAIDGNTDGVFDEQERHAHGQGGRTRGGKWTSRRRAS